RLGAGRDRGVSCWHTVGARLRRRGERRGLRAGGGLEREYRDDRAGRERRGLRRRGRVPAGHGVRVQVLADGRQAVVEVPRGLRGLVLELRQCRGGGPEWQHRGDRRVLGPGRLRRRYAVQLRRRRLPRQALSRRRARLVAALRGRARGPCRQRCGVRRERQRAGDRVVRKLDRPRRRLDEELRAQGYVRREVLPGGRISLVEARRRLLRRRRQGRRGGPDRQGGGDRDVPGGGQLRDRVPHQRRPERHLRGAVLGGWRPARDAALRRRGFRRRQRG